MQVTKTVEMSLSDATKPLLVLSRLVGMNPKSQWHKIYAVCILVCEFLILWLLYHYHIERQIKTDYFFIFVHGFKDLCRIISLLIILGSGLIDQKRFMVPEKAIANVDASLNSLGVCIDNRETYRFQILLFIYAVLMPFLFWLVSYIIHTLVLEDGRLFIISLMSGFFNLTIVVTNAITDSCFSSILSIIRGRFKKINSMIGGAGNHGSYSRVNFVEVSRAHSNAYLLSELKILRKEYHILWGIANEVNDAYGLHLLVGITTSLALITSKLWESYYASMNTNNSIFWLIVEGICWVVFYIMRALFLVQTSESTVAEAKAASVVLQELGMNGLHNRAIKDEIRDFLMQQQLEARNFTACGFFDIDFKLICGILGAVCTYFVILIQMGDYNNGCALTTGPANGSIQFGNKIDS